MIISSLTEERDEDDGWEDISIHESVVGVSVNASLDGHQPAQWST